MANATPEPSKSCTRCGASATDATADALCVRCLLEVALTSMSDEADEVAALIGPESLLKRREFAGYELLGELGRGGMGVVFRARQAKLDREVALKIIAAGELASPRMIERFRTEAEAAARLQHPHIVPILDVGSAEGWHYFSMRLVEGGTLAGRLQQGKLPITDAVRVITTIARAVHHAHQHGVLHRDLKPTNILLDAHGEPHLTDFGLAKIVEQNRDFTLTSAVLGTPAYMAPEQASGQTRDATVAADVYSLGAMFYEMLAGRPPFAAASTPALLRLISEESARTFHREADTDHDLEIICLKCLEKSPGRRYASAAELADDVERWRRGEPIHARAATTWERAVKWTRRHPAKAALVVIVPILLLVITAGSLWFSVSLATSRRALEASGRETRRELLSQHFHEASLRAAGYEGYAAMLPLVEALRLEQSDNPAAPQSLERLQLTWQLAPRLVRLWDTRGTPVTLAFSADNSRLTAIIRNGGERVWQLDSGRELSATESGVHVTKGPIPLVGRRASADGRWVAVADGQATRVSEARGGAELFQVKPSNLLLDQDFSPDGSFFATASFGDQAEVRTMPDGARHRFALIHNNGANRVLFSPDGRLLATAGFDYQVRLHHVGDLRPAAPAIQHGALVEALTFSADGRYLATGDAWGTVRVFDLYLHQDFVPPGATLARRARISPDGRLAALVTAGRSVQLWEIAARRPSGEVMTSRGPIAQTVFDPSGRWLAVASGKNGVQVWQLSTQRAVFDLPSVGTVAAVAFNPDGTKLLVALDDNSAQVWNLAERRPDGPVMQRTTFTDGRPLNAELTSGVAGSESTWSPDGRWIVIAGGMNFASVWEAATGQPVGEPIFSAAEVRDVSFSPDHRQLVLAFNDRNIEPAYAQRYALPSLSPLGAPLRHGDGVISARFNPAGDVLATASHDGVVRLWRASDGEPMSPEFLHRGILVAQNFNPSGKILATSAGDRAFRLWDTARGELMAPPLILGNAPQSIEFLADGATLVFGSPFGATNFFHFQPVTWTPDSWRRLAVCLNGVKLDDRGQRIRVSPGELATTFAGLQAAQPADFAWNTDAAGWHRQCAATAELQGDWFTAAFHLERLVAKYPTDTALSARLAAAKLAAKW